MRTFLFFGFLIVFGHFGFAQQPTLVIPVGHTGKVISTEFSPDAKRFLTASADRTAKLWDTDRGKLLKTFNGFEDEINVAMFSPDGNSIVIGGGNKIKIFDAMNGQLIKDIEDLKAFILVVKFIPNSQKILVGLSDGTVSVININSGKTQNTLQCYDEPKIDKDIPKLSKEELEEMSEDEKTDYNSMLSLFKGSNRIIPYALKDIHALNISPNKKMIVASCSNYLIKIWNLTTFKQVTEINRMGGPDINCEFSNDNKTLLAYTKFGFSDLWNVSNGKKLFDLDNSGKGKIIFSSFFRDNKIITLFENGKMKIYDLPNGKFLQELRLQENLIKISSAWLSPDNTKIISANTKGELKIWDLKTGKLSLNLIGHSAEVKNLKFSTVDNKIASSSIDNTAKVWDLEKGILLVDTKSNSSIPLSAFFSSDNKSIVTANDDNTLKIWETSKGIVNGFQRNYQNKITFGMFVPKENKIVVGINDGSFKMWNPLNSKDLILKPVDKKWFSENEYLFGNRSEPSEKAESIYPTSGNAREKFTDMDKILRFDSIKVKDEVHVFKSNFKPFYKRFEFAFDDEENEDNDKKNPKRNSLIKEKPLLVLSVDNGIINFAKFSLDGQRIITTSSDFKADVWSANFSEAGNARNLFELKGHTNSVIYGDFSFDGKKAITSSADGTAKIWTLDNNPNIKNRILTDFVGHSSQVNSVQFSSDEKRVLTSSMDNTCKVWDAKKGTILYTFFSLDSLDYMTVLPNGYYLVSKNATKQLHYVSKDLNIITFEQLDVKYNRPDKVLQAIGNPDTSLINSYKRAYEKRIKKLGIDTTAFRDDFTIPEAKFVNKIDQIQTKETITLQIRGEDRKNKLDQFNVWVNEVPIYGLSGVNIRKQNINTFERTITIPLSVGENKIEMSVRNINGVESYRSPLIVNYKPVINPKEKVYFVGIGIDKFEDSSHNLMYSAKDIQVLAKEMKKKYGDNIDTLTLINKGVMVKNVKAIKKKLLSSTVNDKVIVAYSGHGLLNGKKDYYLSTYSVNFKKPEENGLSYDELESILDSIPARKKLLLIDACHSGEIDKDDEGKNNLETTDVTVSQSKSPKEKSKVAKVNEFKKGGPQVKENNLKSTIGLKNSFELMQNLFVNVGKNTGATIFTAAAGKQAAYESNNLEHSIFTYYVLEAMRKYPTLKISKFKEVVAEKVEIESRKSQIPTSRSETIAVDWVLW